MVMLLRKTKSMMPTAETALPGRANPIPTAAEPDNEPVGVKRYGPGDPLEGILRLQ